MDVTTGRDREVLSYFGRDREVLSYFDSLVVSYSAGKDSTACLLWALATGLPVRAIWCDTGNEPPESPDYLEYIERELGVSIERLVRPGRQFDDFVRQRRMWPIPGRCLVSSRTKREAMAWYLNNTETSKNALLILGQRRSESAGRAALPDFTPASRSGLPVYRPILDWSLDDVFQYLDDHGVMAHPAYAKGRKRVGCVWCVHSRHDDLVRDEQLYPERCAELRALRAEIGLSSVPAGIEQATMFEPDVCKYESVHCE